MKIGLVGTFDVNNFGDCLFPELYVHELMQRLPGAELKFFSPTSRAAEILSLETVDQIPVSKKDIEKFDCDVLILIGGETLTIGHSLGTYIFPLQEFSAALRLWLAPLLYSASSSGKIFCIHSVGKSGIPTEVEETMTELLSHTQRLSVRDEFSSEFFSKFDIDHFIDIDPVFRISLMATKKKWHSAAKKLLPSNYHDGNYVVAQISSPYLHVNIRGWCEQIARISRTHKKKILLLPICHFLHDAVLLKKAQKILHELEIDAILIPELLNVKETVAILALSSGYCGSSLHGAVVALSFAKPVSVLSNSADGKHTGVMQSVGLQGVVANSFDDLPGCFTKSLEYDLGTISDHAMERADAGLEELVRSINVEKSNSELDMEAIDRIIRVDQQAIHGMTMKVKRMFFRLIKNNRYSGKLYFWVIHKIRKRI